jgi:excisionase family DNA binding protein
MGETDYSSEYLTVEQVAAMLHVTRHTVYQRLRHGTLTAHKSGKRWLFKLEDVEATMNPNAAAQSKPTDRGEDHSHTGVSETL